MYRNFLESFLNIPLRSACFADEAFSGKKQNFCSWDYLLQVLGYEDFQIVRHCCTCLPELEIRTESCSRTLGYFMMDISDQNIESDGMIKSGSVCRNLEAVLTYSEVLPQN